MKCLAGLLVPASLVLMLAGCRGSGAAFDPSTEVRQHVTFYFKRPGNDDDRAKLLAAVPKFGRLPGVIEAVAGRPIAAGRAGPGEAPAFDAVMLLTLADEGALRALVQSPEYRALFDTELRPLLARFDVADTSTERYDVGQAFEKAVEIDTKGRRERATKAMLEPRRPGS
ncbi:MAG TPA: hypothetical protein VF624_00235 [Tepidisphaeraceae bacterium]|jgi:hypothetical protein